MPEFRNFQSFRSFGFGRPGTPQIITATVNPVVQSVVDGDTWADLLLASATDTANYASSAGTISTAVAEVNVDSGGWTALSGNEATALTEGESVQVRVTVTDSEANERVFIAGTVVVAGASSGNGLLLEIGDFILLETGDQILNEAA